METDRVFGRNEDYELALEFLEEKANILACSATFNNIQASSKFSKALVIDPIINPLVLFQSLPAHIDQNLLISCLSSDRPLLKSKEDELARFLHDLNSSSISELISPFIPPPLSPHKSLVFYITSSSLDVTSLTANSEILYEKSRLKLDPIPSREKIIANIMKNL